MATNITHIQLSESERRLANMRAAMLGVTLSQYVGQLVRTDAERTGLAGLVERKTDEEANHG